MAALTQANVKIAQLADNPQSAPQKGSTTIFQNGIVMLDGSGFAKPGATAAGCVGVGVASDNDGLPSFVNGGADGAKLVTYTEGTFGPFGNSAGGDEITAASVGRPCYIVDDQTVALTSNSGARSPAGRVHSVDSSGVFVTMGKSVARQVAALAAITALTDDSAGTANNTIAAMPNPTDTPASADALRDDIVANLLPAIRNNFADVAAKVNEILAAMK